MRDYSKVAPQFWIGKTGKLLRKAGYEAQIVAMYLMTSPHANMLGLYYISKNSIGHETGLGEKGACKGLAGCFEAGFCSYDDESEMVWVHEMASYQIADHLVSTDKRCAGVQNEYNSLPDNPYLEPFFDKYKSAFNMLKVRQSEAPSKPLRSQEQEQEQEQKQDHEQASLVEQNQLDVVAEIFQYWQKIMESPKSVLDANRKKLIANALKNYSPADICKAIRGCSKSPHNMGQNDQKTKYNGLDLILRNAEKIDRFIALDAGNAKSGKESIDEANERVLAEYLGGSALDDGMTIDMEAR